MKAILNKGFTVVELAVVIAVIAVLATIGVVAYRGAIESADDGKMQAEYNDIRNAIELYEARHNRYPECPGGVDSCPLSAITPQLGVSGLQTVDEDGDTIDYAWDNSQGSDQGYAVLMFDVTGNRWCVMKKGGVSYAWPSTPLCWQ